MTTKTPGDVTVSDDSFSYCVTSRKCDGPAIVKGSGGWMKGSVWNGLKNE